MPKSIYTLFLQATGDGDNDFCLGFGFDEVVQNHDPISSGKLSAEFLAEKNILSGSVAKLGDQNYFTARFTDAASARAAETDIKRWLGDSRSIGIAVDLEP